MTDTINPLLAKAKLPGRIFQLPSRGLFYKNGELADHVKNGEVHVHPLSAIDEIIMKNPDQLFSGQAVNTVFATCVDGVLKPTELLARDVDAIMMFLRTVTYGPAFDFTVKHNCKDAKEHSYEISLDEMIAQMPLVDPTTIDLVFTLTLPNEQVVKLRPNRYANVIELVKSNVGKKELTPEDMKANLKAMLTGIVLSVDGIDDPKLIEEWAAALQAPWANMIAQKLEAINDWGPTMRATVKCRDCGEDFPVELPINPVSFFTE